jgi:hypothetical protein
MLRRVAHIRTFSSNEHITSISTVKIISELRALTVTSSLILFNLMLEAIRSSETSLLTRVTRRHIPGDGILYSRHREILKPTWH